MTPFPKSSGTACSSPGNLMIVQSVVWRPREFKGAQTRTESDNSTHIWHAAVLLLLCLTFILILSVVKNATASTRQNTTSKTRNKNNLSTVDLWISNIPYLDVPTSISKPSFEQLECECEKADNVFSLFCLCLYIYMYICVYHDISSYIFLAHFYLPKFDVSNSVLFLSCTHVLPFSIDVVLTLSIWVFFTLHIIIHRIMWNLKNV